jgi:hypothetical protein
MIIGNGNVNSQPKGHQVINKYGENNDIDAADVPIEIWSHGADGTNFIFLDAGVAADIVSTSVNDDIAGTGAQKARVTYYTTDNTEITVDIELDGITQVQISDDLKICTRIEIIQTGTGNINAGEINIVDRASGLLIYQSVEVGEGQTLSAIQICPKGKQGIVKKHTVSYSKVQAPFSAADMRLRKRAIDGTTTTKHLAVISANNLKDEVEYNLNDRESGIKFTEGEIIYWECIAVGADNTPIEGRFDIEFRDIA